MKRFLLFAEDIEGIHNLHFIDANSKEEAVKKAYYAQYLSLGFEQSIIGPGNCIVIDVKDIPSGMWHYDEDKDYKKYRIDD